MSVLVYDCGSVENTVTAILDTESGAMIIRGNGDIDNYADESSPWYSEHSDILQVTVDKGITRIGSGTFYGCENLSFVEIANTVTSIGADIFQNCTSLTSIKIPKSITEIGNGAFTDSGLTEVKFYGNPPNVGTDIFDGVTADIYTPEGNEEWTETAKGTVAGNGSNLTWKEFDSKPNLIEYDELDYLWSKIKKYVDNNVSVTQVVSSGTKIATITVNGVDTDLYSSPFSGTVGDSTTPIYIDNGVPTACGSSLAVDITGNAATATKLTSSAGNSGTPIYFNGGVPVQCTKTMCFAGNKKLTTAGWYRVANLPATFNGFISLSKGYNNGEPRNIIFYVDNNFGNATKVFTKVIATTNSGGNHLTKARIVYKFNTTSYFEVYITPTTETWSVEIIPLVSFYETSSVNFTAGTIPDGYTSVEFDVPNTSGICPVSAVRSTGSASKPVYVDANGLLQACTSVDLNAATATTATNTNNAKLTHTVGNTEYPLVFGSSFVTTDAQQALRIGTPTATAANCALRCKAYCAAANTQGEAYLVCGNNLAKASANNARGSIYLYGTSTAHTQIVPGNNSTSNVVITLPASTGTLALTSSNITGSSASCTGNAATATSATSATTATNANNLKTTTSANGTWYSMIGVPYTDTSGANSAVYRCSTSLDAGFINQANSANTSSSLNAYTMLRIGNNTANAASGVGRRGVLRLYDNSTHAFDINTPDGATANAAFYLPKTGGNLALTSSNITGNAANVTGTVAIANGGTGATTRLNALKALTNEDVGANATYFLTITNSWGKGGYTSVANAKTVLGIKNFVKSGSTAAAGFVPSPGTTAGTTKFLCEDATWKVPSLNASFVHEQTYNGTYLRGEIFKNTSSGMRIGFFMAVKQGYNQSGSETVSFTTAFTSYMCWWRYRDSSPNEYDNVRGTTNTEAMGFFYGSSNVVHTWFSGWLNGSSIAFPKGLAMAILVGY